MRAADRFMSSRQVCSRCGVALEAATPDGYCLGCMLREGLEPPGEESPAGGSQRFGNYELLEKIGQGGMGVVYRARQINLDRVVALKLLPFSHFTTDEAVQRFQAEASSAAGLHHPNIVSIHDVGQHEGQHYFSMELIEGQTLAELVRERPLSARQAATCLKTVAEAVQHAHERGILHRDLKPSNILMDTHGQPRITDFGLAKRLTVDSDMTLTGQVLGSPNFMAPEQAEGRAHAIGPVTEVYSLGALLYHLLTRQPPFQADTLATLLRQVAQTEPVPPRLLNPSLPRDLETICLKCLEKEPARRYESARALAEDLGRFLDGEAVLARPVGAVGRAARWCRRQPGRAGLLASLMLVFLLGLTGVLWQWREARNNATAEAHQRELATKVAYVANIGLADSLIKEGYFDRARELLLAIPEAYRGWEWGWLQRSCHQDRLTLSSTKVLLSFAVFTPDMRFLATGGMENEIHFWDLESGREIRTFRGHQGAVLHGAFSPDGGRFASAGWRDSTARIWDTATGLSLFTLPHPSGVKHVAFSPKGDRLLTTCMDGQVRLWDPASGKATGETASYGDYVECAEFSPDGRRIAYSGGHVFWGNSLDTSLRIWDLATRQTRRLDGHTELAYAVAWSPRGDRLASAGLDGRVKLWDPDSGRELGTLESTGGRKYAISIGFSPDGRLLGVAGGETLSVASWAEVFDLESRRPVRQLSGHSGVVMAIAFSQDGQQIATASRDGTLKLWPVSPMPSGIPLEGHDQVVCAVAFSPDGRRVATGSFDQTARIWDAESGLLTQTISTCFPVVSLAYSPDGTRLLTPGPDHTGCVWPIAPRDSARSPVLAGTAATPPEGAEIASGGAARSGTSPADPAPSLATVPPALHLRGHSRAVMAVAWSPDDLSLATGSKDGTARIWDAQTGRERLRFTGHTGWVRAVAFAPDGRLLATGSADGTIRLWDAQSGQCQRILTNHAGAVLALAFSPAGRWFASGSDDLTARIWDTHTGQELVPPLRGHPQGVNALAFSPDGQRLVTTAGGRGFHEVVDRDFLVRLWDVPSGRPLLSLVPHTNAVYAVAFSPEGRRLVTGSFNNTAAIQTAFPWNSADYPGDGQLPLATRIEAYKRRLWPPLAPEPASRLLSPGVPAVRRVTRDWLGELSLPPPGVKIHPLRPIPSRSAEARPNQLDLSRLYNVALNESWQPVDSIDHLDLNLAALPAGCHVFAEVPFDARGLIQLRRAAPDFELFPEAVVIPVGGTVERLHCLHGTRYAVEQGLAVAAFVLHYTQGTSVELPVLYGVHLRQVVTLRRNEPACPEGQVAWTAPVPSPGEWQPRLFKSTFANPNPGLEVARVEYVSKPTRSGPFLVALTVEPGGGR